MMKDLQARRAAVAMLAKGLMTVPEVAALAGVSRQLVRHWARHLRWAAIREHRNAKLWRKEIGRER